MTARFRPHRQIAIVVTGLIGLIGLIACAPAAEAFAIRGNHVIVGYGAPPSPHARIVFNKNRAARQGVTIETIDAGAAGSKLSVLIDQKVLFAHTFAPHECKLVGQKSACATSINSRDVMSARVRDGFRRGRISRLQLETGGVMSMQRDVELTDYQRATRGRRAR